MDEIIKDWKEKLKDLEADRALIDLEIHKVQKEKDRNRMNDTELAVKERRLKSFIGCLLNLDYALSELEELYKQYDQTTFIRVGGRHILFIFSFLGSE